MSPSATLNRTRVPAGATAVPPPPARRRRRSALLLVAALMVLLLAAVGWLGGLSSVLAARTVVVTGTRTLTAAQVRTAAQVPLGTPLARQPLQRIADRVATLRPVSFVHVTRSWPHAVRIDVQERVAVLAVHQADGYLLVDATGTGYLTVPSRPDAVVLTEANPTDARLLSQVAVVAAALPARLRERVDAIHAGTSDGIRLFLSDGDIVVWGSAEESTLKAEVVTALLKRPATTYDVSAPQSPALR